MSILMHKRVFLKYPDGRFVARTPSGVHFATDDIMAAQRFDTVTGAGIYRNNRPELKATRINKIKAIEWEDVES